MTCDEAREILWPAHQPQLVAAHNQEAREHVDGCQACRDFLAESQVLADAYEQLACARASLELRERIFDAIAVERAGGGAVQTPQLRFWSRVPRRWAAGAAAVAVIASGALVARPVFNKQPTTGEAFVDDYLRRAVSQERIASSDPGTVRRWLARELGLALRPLALDGVDLKGAEICLLNGRRGAMIRYEVDGGEVSHYLVPRSGASDRAPAFGPSLRQGPATAPPLVTWSIGEVEQALVGDVGQERLMALARSTL